MEKIPEDPHFTINVVQGEEGESIDAIAQYRFYGQRSG